MFVNPGPRTHHRAYIIVHFPFNLLHALSLLLHLRGYTAQTTSLAGCGSPLACLVLLLRRSGSFFNRAEKQAHSRPSGTLA